jgi:signal transduction histidine kinase
MLRDPDPVRLADIRRHPSFEGWPAAHPVLTDFIGVPIIDGDRILGELFLANKQSPGGFTGEDEELLRLLAAHAAIALVNARLYERSRELSIVEERNRIARELHDAVTQKLFSLRLTAESADTLLSRAGTAGAPELVRAGAELATVRRLAAEAADELRDIVVGLRPADLAGGGLDMALRKQVALLDRVHGAAIRFTGGPVPRLTGDREQAAYRIAQEALHNALRHADARHIEVSLAVRDGSVLLEVGDDGRGFEPVRPGPGPDGIGGSAGRLGLASMRDRARSVGGQLSVDSRPGGGTTVRLAVPLNGNEVEPARGKRPSTRRPHRGASHG